MTKYLLFSALFLLFNYWNLMCATQHALSSYKTSKTTLSHTISFYNLEKPAQILDLPPILKEISDLDFTQTGEIMCVQDELGIIFVLNPDSGTIKQQYNFHQKGDYEGITYINDTLVYVLQSEGNLFEISHYKDDSKRKIHKIGLNLSSLDHEGLCLDKQKKTIVDSR